MNSHSPHLDHGLTEAQLEFVLDMVAERNQFFIQTYALPEHLGDVPLALYGPIAGDPPVPESEVFYRNRGGGLRGWPSRLVNRPLRSTNLITIIAGPGEHTKMQLYTAFGGPLAPKEPGDPSLTDDESEETHAFWKEHALAAPKGDK